MRTTSIALIACLAMTHALPALASGSKASAASAARGGDASRPKTQRIIKIPRTASTPRLSEEERYAVREAISKEAQNFRGGDPIVITATAAIIILLGVIIIILLV